MDPPPSQYEEVQRADLPLLVLTPFTTAAPLVEVELANGVDDKSPFKGFSCHLDYRTRHLKGEHWGGLVCAVRVLQGFLDGNLDPLYRKSEDESSKMKILPSITHRISEFIAAFRFYDVVVRLGGGTQVSYDVLRQPRGEGYIGDKPYMGYLHSITELINDFLKAGEGFLQLQAHSSTRRFHNADPLQLLASATTDPLFQIAQGLSLSTQAKRALKVVRNLSALAFTVRLLVQAECISVPATYSDLLRLLPPTARPTTADEEEVLSLAMKDSRGLRQSFELAAMISPLLGIMSRREIQHLTVCSEEVLINSKLLGNCKPLSIASLEDQVWGLVIDIGKGYTTAFEAVIRLHESWTKNMPLLSPEDDAFFSRATPQNYDPARSMFKTSAIQPYPESWPLNAATRRFILQEPNVDDPQASTASPGTPPSTTSDYRLISGPPGPENPNPPTGQQPTNGADEGPQGEKERRRSLRERKVPDPNPAPTFERREKSKRKRGPGSGDVPDPNPAPTFERREKGKRKQSPGSGDVPDTTATPKAKMAIPTIKIQEVHRNTLSKQKEIIAETVVKMEAVEPIHLNPDVSDDTPVLTIGVPVQRYSDQHAYSFDIWDAAGHKHRYNLLSHRQDTFESMKVLLEAIKAQHCPGTGRPRWLDDPSNALLRVFTRVEYDALRESGVTHLQSAFSKQNFVVHKYSTEVLAFNLEGLERAGNLRHITSVQDQSIPESGNECIRAGTLEQVYLSSVSAKGHRKILNALQNPSYNERIDPHDPIGLFSDVRAWFCTKTRPHCSRQMRSEDVRWHIVGTEGACHFFHVDPHGDGTFVLVRVGEKAWILAVPLDEDALLETDLWIHKEPDITKLDFAKWKVEMILLTPGDLLIQWPHISHAVYTPKNAICSGGHFIATATLRRTILGIVHTFFVRNITNTDHPAFPARINSLVCFYFDWLTGSVPSASRADAAHLPNLELLSGFMDLVYLGCIVELQNALCPLSYEECNDPTLLVLLHQHSVTASSALSDFDFSAMAHELRVQNVYSRGRMVSLLKFHLPKRFLLRDDAGKDLDLWDDIFIPTLAHFITALASYHTKVFTPTFIKRLAQRGEPHPVPPALFGSQIRSSARRWDELDVAFRIMLKRARPKTLFPSGVRFSILRKSGWGLTDLGSRESESDYRALGMRSLDCVYIEKYAALVDKSHIDGTGIQDSGGGSGGRAGPLRKRARV